MARLAAVAFASALLQAASQAGTSPPEESLAGLAEDDVCESGDCGLELRQLRAREKAAGVSEHVHQVGEFGNDITGTDMWKETTWGDILLEIEASMNSSGTCEGDTFGTCSVFGCGESRGATQCKSGKCLCAEGYCAKGGACFPKAAQCLEDTSGTCKVTSCASSRGETKCKSGKCLCKTGGCAWKGKCFPVTDTGGSCSLAPCRASRGPTTCHRGRCLCKEGHVAVSGRCETFSV